MYPAFQVKEIGFIQDMHRYKERLASDDPTIYFDMGVN